MGGYTIKSVPFRPGSQEYELWYIKEEYAFDRISLEELKQEVEDILNGTSVNISRFMSDLIKK